jgi:hypothetical protein
MTSLIFYEPQDGGLCRKHALNAYFGSSKITTSAFNDYIKKFDEKMRELYNIHEKTSASEFDMVSGNQCTLVGFILRSFGIYTRYFHINSMYNKKFIIDEDVNFIFVYNMNHIWGIKKHENVWFTVDSLSGVRAYDINQLTTTLNIGFLVPTTAKKEYFRNITLIKSIFDENKITTTDELSKYFISLHEKKLSLGDLEVPFNICVDILDSKREASEGIERFKDLIITIEKCKDFIKNLYHDKRSINNMELVTKSFPILLFKILGK